MRKRSVPGSAWLICPVVFKLEFSVAGERVGIVEDMPQGKVFGVGDHKINGGLSRVVIDVPGPQFQTVRTLKLAQVVSGLFLSENCSSRRCSTRSKRWNC